MIANQGGAVNELPKYARLEIERRWLVDATAVGELANVPYRLIEDLYIGESRLRLRKITDPSGTAMLQVRQEIRETFAAVGADHEPVFDRGRVPSSSRALPGSLRRSAAIRSPAAPSTCTNGRDAGFMIFELEFEDEAAARRFRPPHFVTTEITGDAAFSGFALASSSAGVK